LHHWGDSDTLWPLLRHSSDPLLRTYVIDRLSRLSLDSIALACRIDQEPEVSARRALILILGGLPLDQRSLPWASLAADRLLELYRADADPGIHAAAEWTLRQWARSDQLREIRAAIASGQPAGGRDWYVTIHGRHTMVKIQPVPFRMGAGDDGKDAEGDETPHDQLIPTPFFIADREVTFEQFCEFRPEIRNSYRTERMPADDEPVCAITWFDAIAYCNWLSKKEGISPAEMCYPGTELIKEGMTLPANFRSRTGYRLPMEDEWEYSARASSTTSRFFGGDEQMLPRYGWFINSSLGRVRACGMLMPNDFGLFDMLGNVKEWCQDRYRRDYLAPDADREIAPLRLDTERVARGGTFLDPARVLRSANRYHTRSESRIVSMGFRVARTAPR
jgi:formylglycine-generating enzyme required for sulfatase activity